ncbi:MAG TPA: energy transducer TonB [Terracidiphilus sp.]|jgi:TonB family protein|nr:energy transducer TonB [Terracidiphilus sp.]
MRYWYTAGFAAVVAVGLGRFAQGENAAASAPVKIYHVGHDVTAPQLLPVDFPLAIASDCGETISSKVTLSLIVDTDGVPRNIMFLAPSGNDLDRLAIRLVSFERFSPAKKDGIPVAVGESLEMQLDGCLVESEDTAGHKSIHLWLLKAPGQKLANYEGFPGKVIFAEVSALSNPSDELSKIQLGGQVRPPVALFQPEAGARNGGIRGDCVVRVIVDSNGLPEQPTVARSLTPELDEKAIEAVNRYRFKPAMRDGMQPVPVMISIAINFR